jgi:uncharacterized protein
VLGHGAGGTRRTPLLERLAAALAARGRRVVLHDFPYSARGRRLPDPPPVLEACARRFLEHARDELGAVRVVGGGKSMGGRIASQAVARGAAADGLLFLGYPLHPPGKPAALRDAHLAGLQVPMLFVQGSRDAFARSDLLSGVLRRLGARATLLAVDEGDHSFAVPKRAGRSAAEVEAGIVGGIEEWLRARGL